MERLRGRIDRRSLRRRVVSGLAEMPERYAVSSQGKERTISKPALAVSLVAEYGWCRLDLAGHRRRIGVPATTLHDAVRDLVIALGSFAAGITEVSVRWGSEPGGVFLQFSRIYHSETDSCGIVLQEFADEDWISSANWLPVRGAMIFSIIVPVRGMLDAFISALATLAEQPKDESGKIRHWGWPFPEEEFVALRQLMAATRDDSGPDE
jgi:hypothetical protein